MAKSTSRPRTGAAGRKISINIPKFVLRSGAMITDSKNGTWIKAKDHDRLVTLLMSDNKRHMDQSQRLGTNVFSLVKEVRKYRRMFHLAVSVVVVNQLLFGFIYYKITGGW